MPIYRCTCHHPVQNEMHGAFNRVFNRAKDTSTGLKQYRCTVCSKIITRGKDEKKK